MDGLFEILIILLILMAPLLESLLKRRRGKKNGDGTSPTAERSGSTEGRRRAGGERTSEGLIPPEIWEELTGVRTRPPEEEAATAEAGVEVDDEVDWWREREEGVAEAETPVAAEEIGTDEIRREGIGRRKPREVTAKEAELAARFEQAEARRAVPGVAPTATALGIPRAGGRARRLLRGVPRRRLQDAILLREILGPPLALRE